jgi:hypothetical protein
MTHKLAIILSLNDTEVCMDILLQFTPDSYIYNSDNNTGRVYSTYFPMV